MSRNLSLSAETTLKLEQKRAIASGTLETAWNTFFLLIAVKYFNANDIEKSVIAASNSFGLLLTPLVVQIAIKNKIKTAAGAGYLTLLATASLLLGALSNDTIIFAICCLVAAASHAGMIPLLTHIYQENYPARIRGYLFSKSMLIRIGASVTAGFLIGQILNYDINSYPFVLLIFALSAFYSSQLLFQCPSTPLTTDPNYQSGLLGLIKRSITYLKEDRLFRATLIGWMFVGFGNLMMLPMRVEYLANPKYNMGLTIAQVALITSIIPNVVRLLLSNFWGRVFDKANFFLLRMILNAGFGIGIISFFLSDSLIGLYVGAVLFGAANSGGDVAWSLWVTRFAPKDKTAEYMAIHTFFTGVRGLIAPFLSFYLVSRYSLEDVGVVSSILIAISCILMFFESKDPRAVPMKIKCITLPNDGVEDGV